MTNINARKNTINPTINNNPNRTHNLTPNQVNVRASRGPSANPLQPNQNNNLGNNPTNNVNPPADFGSANNNINNNNLLNNPINNNLINNEINNINNNDRPDNSENDEEDNNIQVPPINIQNEENGDGIPEGAGGEGGEEEQIIENQPVRRREEPDSDDVHEENEERRKEDIAFFLQKIIDKQDKKNNANVLKKSVEKWLDKVKKEQEKEAIKKSIGDFATEHFHELYKDNAEKALAAELDFIPTDDVQGSMKNLAKAILKSEGKNANDADAVKKESELLYKKYLRHVGQSSLDDLMPEKDAADIAEALKDSMYDAYDTLIEEMSKNNDLGCKQKGKIIDQFNKEIKRLNKEYLYSLKQSKKPIDLTKVYRERIKELPEKVIQELKTVVLLDNLVTINNKKKMKKPKLVNIV